ncbi:MAG: hypothetical protein AAFQ98_25335 [Bacteroidota bacterium]
MLGTLPTFVAIFSLVFLAFMLSYTTIRSKNSQLTLALERMKSLAEERINLVKTLLSVKDLEFLAWKEIGNAKGLLRYQNQILSKVDELAVAGKLDEEGVTAFKKHLLASQKTMDEYQQLVQQYNALVTRKPNSFVGKLTGHQPI